MITIPAPLRALRPGSVLALTLAFSFVSLVATGSSSDETHNPNPDALWAGGSDGASKFGAGTGNSLRNLSAPDDLRALAVDPRTGSVWLSDGRVVEHRNPDGTVRWSYALQNAPGHEAETGQRRAMVATPTCAEKRRMDA